MNSMFRFFVIISLIVFSACASPEFRRQRAQDASINTLTWLDSRFGIVDDPRITQLNHRVVSRLTRAIQLGALRGDFKHELISNPELTSWQVFVLDTDAPHAFSTGLTSVVITRGLLLALRSEGELAAVLSHEIAHHLLGHSVDAVTDSSGKTRLVGAPRYSFSVDEELAADDMSIQLLRLASYDVRSSLTAFLSVYRQVGENVPDVFDARLQALQGRVRKETPFRGATVSSREFNKLIWNLKQEQIAASKR